LLVEVFEFGKFGAFSKEDFQMFLRDVRVSGRDIDDQRVRRTGSAVRGVPFDRSGSGHSGQFLS
jgi:hypothetical protein